MLEKKTIEDLEQFYAKVESRYNKCARHYVQEQIRPNILSVQKMLAQIDESCSGQEPAVLEDYIGRIREDYIKMQHLIAELDQKFMLFIMGSGKNGKSTLINALVGRTVAKEDSIPATWKIDVFIEGKAEKVEVKFRDGSEKRLLMEEAERFLAEEEAKQKKSRQAVKKELREFRKMGAGIRVLEQKKAYLNKYKLYHSVVAEAVWPIDKSAILRKYRLVDTPGLRQELDDMIISNAREYYTKADGVIWVLPADKISGAGDRSEIDALIKDYGKCTDNVIAVINHIDKAIENGQTEADILQEAYRLYGDIFPEILLLSAKQAREAQQMLAVAKPGSQEEQSGLELLQKSHLPELQEHLNRTLLANAQQIQIESKTRGCTVLLKDILKMSCKASQLLRKVCKKQQQKKNHWDKDRENIQARLVEEIGSFLWAEKQRIYEAVTEQENQLWDMEDDCRNMYIVDRIICPGQIENQLRQLVNQHCKQLVKLKAYHLQLAPFSEYPDLRPEHQMLVFEKAGLFGAMHIDDDLTDQTGVQVVLGGALAAGAVALLGPVGLLFAGIAATDLGKFAAKFLSRLFGASIADKVQQRMSNQLEKVNQDVCEKYRIFLYDADKEITALREDTYANLYGPSAKSSRMIQELEKICNIADTIRPMHVENVIFGE